ncbi:hypothetical protein DAPPUDRAFT_324709 [Daphnia pulex]|uniref:Lysine-specific demethylase-like domain-containing protein n=1 Tax=Daphnia pulex TaxID=6669 RepID=E9H2I4_DAPPU|nr:hypothetical protein DAPPUDRAFT_324709 [Daphnia pulex]|eukprot:EFX73981.1 hypothetical protein DAPPUDRAFT_324709 [Daphnia pulex]
MEVKFSVPTTVGVFLEVLDHSMFFITSNKLQRIKKCNLIFKQQYKKQYKELRKDKAKLSNEFKSTIDNVFVHPIRNEQLNPDDPFLNHTGLLHTFSSTWKERVAGLGSQALISTVSNHHTEIAVLEHAKLGAEKNLITESFASDKLDDGKDCPVTEVVNSIDMGHIRKRRRRTTEVEVIGTCGSINATAKRSLPVDEGCQSSETAVLGVISVEESDEPIDAAPVTSRHIPQDIPLDVAMHSASERESASPVVYVPDDSAVVTQPGNGYSFVLNASVTSQFSPTLSPEDHPKKFLQLEEQLSTSLKAINLALVQVPDDGPFGVTLNFYKEFNVTNQSFINYVRELEKAGIYGGHYVLAAFSKEFQVPVKVFQPNGSHHVVEYAGSLFPTVQVLELFLGSAALADFEIFSFEIQGKVDSFKSWAAKVREALKGQEHDTVELTVNKALHSDADEQKFPNTDLKFSHREAVESAEQSIIMAQQLISSKVRTRTRLQGGAKWRLTLEEL